MGSGDFLLGGTWQGKRGYGCEEMKEFAFWYLAGWGINIGSEAVWDVFKGDVCSKCVQRDLYIHLVKVSAERIR